MIFGFIMTTTSPQTVQVPSRWGRMAEGSTFEDEGPPGHVTGWHFWWVSMSFHICFQCYFQFVVFFFGWVIYVWVFATPTSLTYDSCEFLQVTTWKSRRKPDSQTGPPVSENFSARRSPKSWQFSWMAPLELRYHEVPYFQTSIFVPFCVPRRPWRWQLLTEAQRQNRSLQFWNPRYEGFDRFPKIGVPLNHPS